MTSDIRLSVSLRAHHKIKKLRRRLGAEGVLSLIFLWIGTAVSKPDGELRGWDAEDISLEAEWPGDPQEFVQTLLDLQFLEKDESGTFRIHGWDKHQAWVIGSDARSQKAKHAAAARWVKQTACSEHARSMPEAMLPDASGNAPLLPSPIHKNITASSDAEKADLKVYSSKKGRKLSGQVLADFERFWEVFNFKRGRAEAADAWLDVYKPQILDQILFGAEREAAARPTLISQGRTPKMAQGWLSGRRWEDDHSGAVVTAKDCGACTYNQNEPCANLSRPGFIPASCDAFRRVEVCA